jgi:tRNA A37 threonylcarbamoyladenosine biosynthesis protein TsaE
MIGNMAYHANQTAYLFTVDIDKPEKCSILDKLLKDCKFYVQTRKGYHFYFKKNDEITDTHICDVADLNTNLFYCPEYYLIDSEQEEYTETDKFEYKLVKSKEIIDTPDYVIDWCKQLILTNTKEPLEPKAKKSNIQKMIVNPNIQKEIFNLDTMRVIYEILLDAKYFDDYGKWIQVAYIGRHLNNTEEGFKLFDEFSRKSEVTKYKNTSERTNRYFFYGGGKYDDNFDEYGILIKCSKLDNVKYKDSLHHLYKSKYEREFKEIDTKYLWDEKKIFDRWAKKEKVLMIKSQYGTGKTYAFKRIMDEYKYKKILFVTYRRSLANSLSLELKEVYKFDNYLDAKKDNIDLKKSKRLLLQLDSIHKIFDDDDDLISNNSIPEYDLVVLDEMEGILNHLSYEKINQFQTHRQLTDLIKQSKKVLCLDGDLSDRSFDFISNITSDYKIYHNKYQPNKKHFVFISKIKYFDELIENDMKNKKKLVIVSMTKTDAEKYYNYYKDKYKVIVHDSIERNKNILEKVNEEWSKADLLIYSPTIESGVDYNVMNHFDKCYSILTNKSTSYRAYFQMLNRVRYYKNNTVSCLLTDVNYYKDGIPYRYDEVRLTKYKGIETTPLVNTLIHNDVERLNNKNYFYCMIVKTIKQKNHTW